jgi:hypothetical protein
LDYTISDDLKLIFEYHDYEQKEGTNVYGQTILPKKLFYCKHCIIGNYGGINKGLEDNAPYGMRIITKPIGDDDISHHTSATPDQMYIDQSTYFSVVFMTQLVTNKVKVYPTAIQLLDRFEKVYDMVMEVMNQKGGTLVCKRVHVLGRDRKIIKVGRKSMVTYKRQLISLTDARSLEKKRKERKT